MLAKLITVKFSMMLILLTTAADIILFTFLQLKRLILAERNTRMQAATRALAVQMQTNRPAAPRYIKSLIIIKHSY